MQYSRFHSFQKCQQLIRHNIPQSPIPTLTLHKLLHILLHRYTPLPNRIHNRLRTDLTIFQILEHKLMIFLCLEQA